MRAGFSQVSIGAGVRPLGRSGRGRRSRVCQVRTTNLCVEAQDDADGVRQILRKMNNSSGTQTQDQHQDSSNLTTSEFCHSPFLCRTLQAEDPSTRTFESTLLTNGNLSHLNCFLSAEFILSFQPHVMASIRSLTVAVLDGDDLRPLRTPPLGDDIIHRVRQKYSDYI